MSKYESLAKHLARVNAPELVMTFAQVEEILGAPLPASARTHRPWWANSAHGHVQSKGWLDAGYVSKEVDLEEERLLFVKLNQANIRDAKDQSLTPVLGWAAGSVKVAAGVDLTAALYSDSEVEGFLNEKSAHLAAGLQG
jgi:hypothetical protein